MTLPTGRANCTGVREAVGVRVAEGVGEEVEVRVGDLEAAAPSEGVAVGELEDEGVGKAVTETVADKERDAEAESALSALKVRRKR